MKNFARIGLLLLLMSCANKIKTIKGDWYQLNMGYEGDKIGYGIVSDSTYVVIGFDKQLSIQFDYQDGYENDLADSIRYKYPQLDFRKQNLNKSFNYYTLVYDVNCDCFNGNFKSYQGNKIKVKWVRR